MKKYLLTWNIFANVIDSIIPFFLKRMTVIPMGTVTSLVECEEKNLQNEIKTLEQEIAKDAHKSINYAGVETIVVANLVHTLPLN